MRDRLFTIQGETFDTMYKIGYKLLILYLVILCLKNILCVNYKNETQPSVANGSSFSKALSQNLLRGEVVIIIGAIIWLLLLGTMAVGVKQTHCLQGLFSSRKSERDLYQVIELQESRENFENEINEIYEQILPHVNAIKGSFPVDVFVKMVKKTTSSDLKSEFKEIPSAVTNACQHAYLEENRRKNRYKRICPYDYNRVKLSMTDMPDYTDYINASYIHGFKNENKFIAAQGPFNHETTLLFWEMVWQSDCSTIVMFTNTREQQRSDETHHVKHYQFTGWVQKESHSVSNAFLQLYNLTHSKEESSPIIVHCSSGIGRTGTYIAFDHLMDEAHETGQLSVQDCIMKLRNQRPRMVQTSDDYQFLLRMLAGNITHVYDEAVTLDL
ncbi:receptor-type tyrosine-protein phosphatase epsilon-like isoform X2 [Crassostrea angulata]|uniref:receptor-type tyrosine-protein phosphatase epsilon-like isoform X2 n=1 Tax=Magallana angulata TaxID=2784310 RepID=UPI0022B1B635|nr:receptor-type tyrosine-protein phosphatase epsilon-like isoform X2 [Crassostrea angulata]